MADLERNLYRSIVSDDIKSMNKYAITHIIACTIGTFVWLPIRAVLVLGSYIVIWIICTVFTYDLEYPSDFTKVQQKPILSIARRRFVQPMLTGMYRLAMIGFGVHYVEVRNPHNLTGEAKIVAFGPHSTLCDTAIIYAIGEHTFTGIAAAAEFFRPLSGKLIRVMDYVGIDYKNPASRAAAAESVVHRATSPDWAKVLNLLACEGGTHNGMGLAQFKRGAFLPGLPVQPMHISCPEWIDRITGNLTTERQQCRGAGWAGWGFDTSLLFTLWYQLATPWQPMIVTILPVYHPSEAEKKDPMLYGKAVREVLAKSLGCKTFETTHMDGYAVEYVTQKYPGLNADHFVLCGAKIEENLGAKSVTRPIVAELIDAFAAKIDPSTGKAPSADLKMPESTEILVSFNEFAFHRISQKLN